MKSRTSWPSSRKYSAIVRPESADAQARARRLVHLAVDERDAVDHAGLLHLEPEVVALAGALADAGEHRHAAVLLGDVVDQLLDQHRLAEAGAAEQADLAAAHERRDQVDDLDARSRRSPPSARGRGRPAGRGGSASARRSPALAVVDRLAEHVPEAAERLLADGDADRRRRCRRRRRRAAGRRSSPWRPRGRGRRPGAAAPRRSGRCRRNRRWPGTVMRSALLISGSAPVKTASMTTPLTSTILPTFRLLSHWTPEEADCARGRPRRRCGGRATGVYRRRVALGTPLREGAAVLRDRGHPGLVIERSAVRA